MAYDKAESSLSREEIVLRLPLVIEEAFLSELSGSKERLEEEYFRELPDGFVFSESDLAFALLSAEAILSPVRDDMDTAVFDQTLDRVKARVVSMVQPDEIAFSTALCNQKVLVRAKAVGNILMAYRALKDSDGVMTMNQLVNGLRRVADIQRSEPAENGSRRSLAGMLNAVRKHFNINVMLSGASGKKVLGVLAALSIASIILSQLPEDNVARMAGEVNLMNRLSPGDRSAAENMRDTGTNVFRNAHATAGDRALVSR